MNKNLRIWLHGLTAAVISATATAGSAALAVPTDFNFTHRGLVNFAKLLAVPALCAAFAYLKQSPVPESSTAAPVVASTVSNTPDAK